MVFGIEPHPGPTSDQVTFEKKILAFCIYANHGHLLDMVYVFLLGMTTRVYMLDSSNMENEVMMGDGNPDI